MRAELSDINVAFNARIEYFVQLQKLSDDVADPNFSSRLWRGLTSEIAIKIQEERQSIRNSSTARF